MKNHGCMFTYILYVLLYLIYFLILGKLLSSMPININSDALLSLTLFFSFVLAVITAILIANRKKIFAFLVSLFKKQS